LRRFLDTLTEQYCPLELALRFAEGAVFRGTNTKGFSPGVKDQQFTLTLKMLYLLVAKLEIRN
jgi:hypothetical protein